MNDRAGIKRSDRKRGERREMRGKGEKRGEGEVEGNEREKNGEKRVRERKKPMINGGKRKRETGWVTSKQELRDWIVAGVIFPMKMDEWMRGRGTRRWQK